MATPIGPRGLSPSNPENIQPKKGILKNLGGNPHEVTTGGGPIGGKVVRFADQHFDPARDSSSVKKAPLPPTRGPSGLRPSRPAPLPPTGGPSGLRPSRPAPLPPTGRTSAQGTSGLDSVETSGSDLQSEGPRGWDRQVRHTKSELTKGLFLSSKIFKKDTGIPEYLRYQSVSGKIKTTLKDTFSDLKSNLSNGCYALKRNISNTVDKLKTTKGYPKTTSKMNRDVVDMHKDINIILKDIDTGRPDPTSKEQQEKLEAMLTTLNALWDFKSGRMPE